MNNADYFSVNKHLVSCTSLRKTVISGPVIHNEISSEFLQCLLLNTSFIVYTDYELCVLIYEVYFYMFLAVNFSGLITVSILYIVNSTCADVPLSIFCYFSCISIFPYFFLGFWVKGEVNIRGQLIISYTIQPANSPVPWKLLFKKWIKAQLLIQPQCKAEETGVKADRRFALVDAVNWDRVNMKF